MNHSRKWVLVAEDDQDVRELIKSDLEIAFDSTVKVIEARDGIEASSKLGYQAFDCILTDLQMPRRNGTQFIEWVKKHPINQNTPIIVVTGFPDPELEARYYGMKILEKPYQREDLFQAVKTQFKLGKLNERLGAEVLNNLIASCQSFLVKILKDNVGLEKPYVKQSGEELPGDLISCLKIKTQTGSCRIGIGVDGTVIDALSKAAGASDENSRSKVLDSALNLIFQQTCKVFADTSGYQPLLEDRMVFTDKTTFAYNEIKSASGIIIPIKTDFGRVYAQAINERSKRRVAA